MLNRKFAFLVISLTACAGPSTLATATSPVGDACTGPSDGRAQFTVGTYASGPSYGEFGGTTMQIVLGENSMRLGCGGLATSGPRFFAPPQLGDHVIDGADVRFSIGSNPSEGWTGLISINGYNPSTGLLCGSVDAVKTGNHVVATFSAQMGCM